MSHEKTDGQLETAQVHGAKAIYHDKVNGAEPQMSPWFRSRKVNKSFDMTQLISHTAAADFVIKGSAPDAPMIDRDTRITAFGSCFAANISKLLGRCNYWVSMNEANAQDAYVLRIGEGMVNSFVTRQQFEWAWENRRFNEALWHGYDKGNIRL